MKRLMPLAAACAAILAVGVPVAGATSHARRTAARPSGLDQEFLKTSMQGDIFEIRGGRIALRHTRNAAVRRLAARLISDHTKSLADAAALARRLHIDVPTRPTASEQWELGMVGTFRGARFNRAYSSLEVADHLQDIEQATTEVKDGSLKAVRDDARTNLPMLRMHLALARAALKASR